MIERELQPEDNFLERFSVLEISIEGELRNKLQTVSTWSSITAIGGFVNLGINILSVLFKTSAYFGGFYLMIMVAIFAVIFFINFFLIKFSINLKKSLNDENQEQLAESAGFLKSYLRLIGILMIISVVFMLFGTLIIMSSSI